jgi:prepilin-type N-terminal cleavage/methylation domain-containing protein
LPVFSNSYVFSQSNIPGEKSFGMLLCYQGKIMRSGARKVPDGFSLMELMAVMIIVGIVAAFALPSYSTHIERVRASEGAQLLAAVLASQEAYRLENGSYATAMADLDIEIPNASNFTVPPSLYNNAARVATIARSDGSYTLCVNSTGVISCDGDAGICGGYAPGGVGVCP